MTTKTLPPVEFAPYDEAAEPHSMEALERDADAFNARILASDAPFAAEFMPYLRGLIKFGRPSAELMQFRPSRHANYTAMREGARIVTFWSFLGSSWACAGAVRPAVALASSAIEIDPGQTVGEALAELDNPLAVDFVAVLERSAAGEWFDCLRLYRMSSSRFDLAAYLWRHHAETRIKVEGSTRQQWIDSDGVPLCQVRLNEDERETASWHWQEPVSFRLLRKDGRSSALVAQGELSRDAKGRAVHLAWSSSVHASCPDRLIEAYLEREGVVRVPTDGGPDPVFGSALRAKS